MPLKPLEGKTPEESEHIQMNHEEDLATAGRVAPNCKFCRQAREKLALQRNAHGPFNVASPSLPLDLRSNGIPLIALDGRGTQSPEYVMDVEMLHEQNLAAAVPGCKFCHRAREKLALQTARDAALARAYADHENRARQEGGATPATARKPPKNCWLPDHSGSSAAANASPAPSVAVPSVVAATTVSPRPDWSWALVIAGACIVGFVIGFTRRGPTPPAPPP